MKIRKNVKPKKVMIKVGELKMFNMMGMKHLNLWIRKKIMLMLFYLSYLFTSQWKVNKGDMCLWMVKVMMCEITQILRT